MAQRITPETNDYLSAHKIILSCLSRLGNGEGILGRTILCRYCRGAKRLPCPLCSVDDPYEWSYGARQDKEDEQSGDAINDREL